MERRLLQRCTIFDLYLSSRRCEDGKTGSFYLVAAPPWVNVVPVVRDGQGRDCFLMVRQYRHGVDRITVEFPAGLVNEGEEPEAAARRELLEETGCRAGSLELIGTIAPNPAFMSNWCYTYLCRDPQETGRQELDEMEVLEVLRVPVREVVERMGQDGYINAMVLTALYWYLRHRGELQP
jgi:8-oxo-dGTP pyrophosphatase MutT (NUDIX family)